MPPVKSALPYRLYNEDCFATFSRLGAGTVDLVLCDPPYGTTQCSWDSVIPIAPMWNELHRVCKPNAAIVLTAMQPFSSVLVTSNLARFKYEWSWFKGGNAGFLNAKKQPLRTHESVLVFYEKQSLYNPQFTKGNPTDLRVIRHQRTTVNMFLLRLLMKVSVIQNPYYRSVSKS